MSHLKAIEIINSQGKKNRKGFHTPPLCKSHNDGNQKCQYGISHKIRKTTKIRINSRSTPKITHIWLENILCVTKKERKILLGSCENKIRETKKKWFQFNSRGSNKLYINVRLTNETVWCSRRLLEKWNTHIHTYCVHISDHNVWYQRPQTYTHAAQTTAGHFEFLHFFYHDSK